MTTLRNPEEFNVLCRKCRRICRQPAHAVLVDCRRFLPYPFKIEKLRFDQLELFPAPKKPAKG